ncbi:unnamed protein product [Prorocentrum cordatum]|nr:unnamed protein product [Polarella glacialis]
MGMRSVAVAHSPGRVPARTALVRTDAARGACETKPEPTARHGKRTVADNPLAYKSIVKQTTPFKPPTCARSLLGRWRVRPSSHPTGALSTRAGSRREETRAEEEEEEEEVGGPTPRYPQLQMSGTFAKRILTEHATSATGGVAPPPAGSERAGRGGPHRNGVVFTGLLWCWQASEILQTPPDGGGRGRRSRGR